MDILTAVQETYAALSLPEREARTIAIASALEPLSDKAGCVTRLRDDQKNSLEMFVAAYNTVMTKPENLGIGPGLGADFCALTIYLALTYGEGEMLIG